MISKAKINFQHGIWTKTTLEKKQLIKADQILIIYCNWFNMNIYHLPYIRLNAANYAHFKFKKRVQLDYLMERSFHARVHGALLTKIPSERK